MQDVSTLCAFSVIVDLYVDYVEQSYFYFLYYSDITLYAKICISFHFIFAPS